MISTQLLLFGTCSSNRTDRTDDSTSAELGFGMLRFCAIVGARVWQRRGQDESARIKRVRSHPSPIPVALPFPSARATGCCTKCQSARQLSNRQTYLLSGEEMTAQRLFLCLSATELLSLVSLHRFPCAGSWRPARHDRCRPHQVVGTDTEPDPSSDAVSASVATAPQAMTSLDHADAASAPDAPALPAPELPLAFVRAPRRRFAAWPRQTDPPHPAELSFWTFWILRASSRHSEHQRRIDALRV